MISSLMTAGCPAKEGGDTEAGTTSVSATTEPTGTSEVTTTATTSPGTTTGMSEPTTTGMSEPTTTTDASSSTGSEMPPAACACIDPEAHGVGSYTCSHDGGCEDVVAFCDVELGVESAGCGLGAFSVDEAALDCAIDHLIAGTPGLVWWNIDSNGPNTSGAWIDIVEARQGVGRTWDFIDLGGTDYDAGTMELKDAVYFQDCKTKPDIEAKFLCFKNWSKTPPDALCDAEAYYSDPF